MDLRRGLLAAGCAVLDRSGIGRALMPLTGGRGLILTLHSVQPGCAPRGFDPNAHLRVTPEFLDHTIRQIRAAGIELVSLEEAVTRGIDAHSGGGKRFAALTFDDGYRDNLVHAYPVLRRHGVPFTIFVTTGFVDRTAEIWWEALSRIVARAETIEVPVGRGMQRFPAATCAQKARVFCHVLHWFTRELGEDSQRLELRRLAERHGVDLTALAEELILSWEELRGLMADPLFTVGAHTHDHFALARLTRERMHADVAKGLSRLSEELGVRPACFAYPYGYEAAVNSEAGEVVAEFGFRAAMTTRPGMICAKSDRMALPRVSLNGYFQNAAVVSQYLTGVPFPVYNLVRRVRDVVNPHPACG
jgi:peptidoglycan/xylan/chitin deacetylase (PgdA/CDA1 family)